MNEARERLKIDQLGQEERMQYYRHIDNLRVQWDVLNTAHLEGREEGKAEGREEGREEGRKEGRKEGRIEGQTQGKEEEKIAVIKKSLALGFTIEIIAQLTGLTPDKIKGIIHTNRL